MADDKQEKNGLDKNLSELDPPYRILSMDAGGIFGTFSAIMLRKLCERDENFLKGNQVTMFAGSSAGAINALILANEVNPRDAIIKDRKLEKFFADSRVYANRMNPVAGALSLVGLTSWSGKADFYSILEDYFGEMKMKDLKHRVMITAFDLKGKPEDVFGQPQWKPKIFYNFPADEPDRELFVKDVAYGAASPPTLRPVRNGITDGGFFASDPTAFAIAKIVKRVRGKDVHPLVEQFHRIGEAFTGPAQQPMEGRIAYLLTQEGREVVVNCLGEMLRSESGREISNSKELRELQRNLTSNGSYEIDREKLDRGYAQLQEIADRKPNSKARRPKSAMLWLAPKNLTDEQRKVLQEFVGVAQKLVDWEYKFWTNLTGVIDAANLSDDVKQSVIERPKQLITLFGLEIKALQGLVANPAEDQVEKLQFSLQRLQLMRELLYDDLEAEEPENLLKHISVLSVGLGAKHPNYFRENFDFGLLPFMTLPTNIADKFFDSPLTTFLMNPAKDTVRFQAKALLGEEDYFRLDPPVIGFPVPSVASAAYLARNSAVRKYLLKKFTEIADSKQVDDQIVKAESWKKKAGWVPQEKAA